jgi:hypothetical protein
LLGYGVPPEWLVDVRDADEDSILDLANYLPAEAAEALLNLATGVVPQAVRLQPQPEIQTTATVGPPGIEPVAANPFEHPDALRRFRVISNQEELERGF